MLELWVTTRQYVLQWYMGFQLVNSGMSVGSIAV